MEQAGWRRYTLLAIAPPEAVQARVWIHSFEKSEVMADFDDFLLEKLPAEQTREIMEDTMSISEVGFPKGDPEQAFSEYKIYQPDGGVLRTPVEDWEGARRRVADSPRWAHWFEGVRDKTEAWMAEPRDRAEWQAGWWHNFVSPVDGAFLLWREEVPGEDTDHLMSKSGDRVEITTEIFEAWVFGVRSRNISAMVEAARLYRLTGEQHYLDWVAGQFDFYADNYEGWGHNPRQRKNSHLGWQSLEDATWLARLTEAARLIFDAVDEERRQYWFEHLLKPQAELISAQGKSIHNISTWFRASAAQVALLYGDDDLWARVVDGPYGLRQQFREGVTSDYFWYEQSMGYNNYVITATYPLFCFAALLGEGQRLETEAAIAENLALAPFAIRFPDGRLPNPADANGIIKLSEDRLGRIYRALPTRPGLADVAGEYNWDTLIDPPAQVEGEVELPPVVSRLMESSRFSLLKKGPWQVFFQFGQLGRSHSQSEALNWSAYFGDAVISQDPGTVGYGSPMSNGYYRRGLTHNIPLVGGEGQQPWKRGTLTDFDAEAGTMSARQSWYRDGVEAERSLSLDGDTLIDSVVIKVSEAAAEGKPLGLALHLEGSAQLGDAFRPVSPEDFQKDLPESFKYWKDVSAAHFEDTATVPVVFDGGLVLDVTFACPGSFTLYVASAPGVPPTRHTAFYLESEQTRHARFVTTLTPAQ
ncbi:heparinase II/III family protein [Ruficoccus sp. ZRK36]|uniref:heparinase II/III domain-containing protein n=1 Tax=Ruficoccus sp. ZRK36 TaxID=2866311 RepID=UPI001C73D0C5|nr:heparinase II/III family protein [Ruficoccus sp. ZRK36]QYY34501.1 heparinase II/III family protein [Ruficoccus sp. ZRK36]